MPVQPAAVDLLYALTPVLTRWGRWYVFGAQAVTASGVPRLSADVDVVVLGASGLEEVGVSIAGPSMKRASAEHCACSRTH